MIAVSFRQVVGEVHAVKNALIAISSRLRESQHRERAHFHGQTHSPERVFPPDDDFIPHSNTGPRRSMERNSFGSRRGNSYGPHPSGFSSEANSARMAAYSMAFEGEDIIFRILCPTGKMNRLVSESEGIVDLLQKEIGVDVKISGPVAGSEERVIIISSKEVFIILYTVTATYCPNVKNRLLYWKIMAIFCLISFYLCAILGTLLGVRKSD